jgi:hypothetical protein
MKTVVKLGVALLALVAVAAAGARTVRLVSTAHNAKLGRTILVQKGVQPAGVRGLGTVRRPDHRIQVTYRGAPLYTFYLDSKRGDINGNGFRDVGVWHPAALR